MNMRLYNKIFKRGFSHKWEGIVGDVNWKDGKLIDGRPKIDRHHSDLPKKKFGSQNIIASDYADLLKELDNPIYLTYNKSKRGAGKLLDIWEEKYATKK